MGIKKNKLPIIILGILIIALPLLLFAVKQTLDNRSNAAAADKLEAEGGTLGGNTKVQADTNASGGQYVLFANQTTTPTPVPVGSCTGIGPDSGGATAKTTYHSLSLYWSPSGGSSTKTVIVKYRKKGDCSWRNGLPIKYNPISGNADYRGSIVNLTPNTEYEIELTLEGTSTTSTVNSKTWTENPPEGTVTTIPNGSLTYNITGSGTVTAYRVYDGKGATIDVANNSDNGININASNIILRNINVKGAKTHGIRISGGKDIIIENCDVSGWGQIEGPNGFGQNYNSGIYSSNTSIERVTVQRCKIHHPRTDANSWSEDSGVPTTGSFHPRGPQCITFFDSLGNHVLRYNECYSDFTHQFNDGFGAGSNSSLNGFPGPDSDIYNNYVSNTWDDGMEIEGGGKNVRVWNNYIENAFIPYANASVTIGPLYLFRNVSGRSDSSSETTNNSPGYFLKAGYASSESNMNGAIYLFNNTVTQPNNEGAGGFGSAGTGNRIVKHTTSRNNVLQVRSGTTYCTANNASNSDNDLDYDLCTAAYPSGYQTHKITGSPIYTNGGSFNFSTKTGDFRLSPGSPGFSAGYIIPNFSDGFSGNAPDLGAQQNNESPMKYGTQSSFNPPQIQ